MVIKPKKSRYFEYQEKIRKSYQELKRAYDEVQDSYAEMVFRLALVAEYKDDSTGTHLVRIADYSTEIGREMRLSLKDINYLKYASVMHDIGKLVVPDAILKKASGLTPESHR
jgi:putative two-component system response regulator